MSNKVIPKRGDRLRCLIGCPGQFTKGKIYTAGDGCTTKATRILADDVGDANGWDAKKFKFVRSARTVPTKTQTAETFQCSFKELHIEPPAFAKLLALNGLAWTNRKKMNNSFVWGFEDGHIVTTNCPLTGNNSDGHQLNIGFAEDVGVEGTKSFRDRVAKFMKRHATFNEFYGNTRRFV
jgi:hypothetical protein